MANNMVSLGGTAILIGYVGDDENGKLSRRLLKKAGIRDFLFTSRTRPTITKMRVFDGERQVTRMDDEHSGPLSKQELASFSAAIRKLPSKIDMVIVSDYAKGTVSQKTMQILRDRFSGEKIVVDTKPIHRNLMHGLCMITPNLKEMSAMAGVPLRRHEDIRITAARLAKELNTSVLATLGREGMILCDKNDMTINRIRSPNLHAIDVTGAGDVATAAFTLAVASGASFVDAAKFANRAASISVTKLGTATVTLKEI